MAEQGPMEIDGIVADVPRRFWIRGVARDGGSRAVSPRELTRGRITYRHK